jgi:hypothetical protein
MSVALGVPSLAFASPSSRAAPNPSAAYAPRVLSASASTKRSLSRIRGRGHETKTLNVVPIGFPPPDLSWIPTPAQVFAVENAAIFPLWGAMMFAPKNRVTKAVMRGNAVPFLTCGVYLYLTWFSFHDPRILEAFSTGKPDLAALAKGFSYQWCMAVGWAHFIAMDLFVGRWVYLDSQKNDVFAAHSLLLTLFFGPTGAVSHVITRGVTGMVRGEKLIDVMDTSGEK